MPDYATAKLCGCLTMLLGKHAIVWFIARTIMRLHECYFYKTTQMCNYVFVQTYSCVTL